MTDVASFMLSNGFHEVAPCNCGGVRTRKFRKGALLLKYRPGHKTFKLLKGNVALNNFSPLNELDGLVTKILAEAE